MVEALLQPVSQGALEMAQHCGGKGRHSVRIVFCTSGGRGKPSRRAVRARLRKVRAEQDRLDRYAVPWGTKAPTYSAWGWLYPWGTSPPLWRRTDPRQALFRQFHRLPAGRGGGRRGLEEVLAAAEELGPGPLPGRRCASGRTTPPDGACGLRHAAALLARLDARVTLVFPAPVVGAAGRRGGALGQGLGRVHPRSSACIWAGRRPDPSVLPCWPWNGSG